MAEHHDLALSLVCSWSTRFSPAMVVADEFLHLLGTLHWQEEEDAG